MRLQSGFDELDVSPTQVADIRPQLEGLGLGVHKVAHLDDVSVWVSVDGRGAVIDIRGVSADGADLPMTLYRPADSRVGPPTPQALRPRRETTGPVVKQAGDGQTLLGCFKTPDGKTVCVYIGPITFPTPT